MQLDLGSCKEERSPIAAGRRRHINIRPRREQLADHLNMPLVGCKVDWARPMVRFDIHIHACRDKYCAIPQHTASALRDPSLCSRG